MLPNHIALVSRVDAVPLSDLAQVSAALQKQVTRDFSPIWEIDATVDCFGRLEDVPGGYWVITIEESTDAADPNGIHQDRNRHPFAAVYRRENWSMSDLSVSLSHEALEMLVNPTGDRTIPGQSPDPSQGRVDFAVEVCDPCEAESYPVNGIAVSDFYTPNYFDPVVNSSVRYSFKGTITKPREVLIGGYLSWHDPVSDHLFSQSRFRDVPVIADLGKHPGTGQSLRSIIYAKTPEAFKSRLPSSDFRLTYSAALATVKLGARSRAKALRQHISTSAKRKAR